jgi:hypothetical protein
MKTNPMMLKFAGLALVTMAGAGAFIACSSDDNAAPTGPVLTDDGGGSSGASSSGASSSGASSSGASSSGASSSGASSGGDAGDAGPVCAPDGGTSAVCNSCATVGGDDPYNACSAFPCQGKYDNTAHNVPSPLPTVP